MKKSKIKIRVVCLLLALMTLLALFAACVGGTDPENSNPEASASDTAAGDETKRSDEISDLPSDLRFEGETFTMLLRSDRGYAVGEFCVELDSESDIIETAIYARQQEIEEKLGITFIYESLKEAELVTRIRNTAQSGDAYDVACPGASQVGVLCTEGYLGDWKEVEHVGLDKVWWGSRTDLVENLTINNKIYVISGDASNMSVGKVLCMYFNKNMLDIYGNIKDEEMYNIVLDGNWTIDKLLEISANITRDTDGDTVLTENDLWGCNFYLATIADNYFAAFDIPIVTKKGDDYSISLNTPRMVTAVEKLTELCRGSNNPCYLTKDKKSSQKFFMTNHAVFTHGGLEWASEMSDMPDDFGIIPYPKLDLDQKAYKATLSDVYTTFVFIDGVTDTEKLGAVMELIGSISYETTTVAYYDTVLKGQAVRDSASWTTMDLIHDSITYDMGYLFASALGNPNHAIRKLMSIPTLSWASYWATTGTAMNKKLQALIESFED